jgi:hypothetical protein
MPSAFDAMRKGPAVSTVRAKAADGKVRVQDVVQHKDGGMSVEEARAAMIAAGEAPSGRKPELQRGQGGSTTAPAAPRGVRSVRVTVIEADGSDGESDVLTSDASDLRTAAKELQDAVNNIHARAQKAGRQVRVDMIQDGSNQPPVTLQGVKAASSQPLPEQKVVLTDADPAPQQPKVERRETNRFIMEIRQENGGWVAEIQYKNGSGVERFEARTKDELNLKLLEGKGNATLRVRESVRREKYGLELDEGYPLPEGLTEDEFNAMPLPARQVVIDNVAVQEGTAFTHAHPEYYGIRENQEKMIKFLDHLKRPYTFKNLEYAFYELSEAEELEMRPAPQPPAPQVLATPSVQSTAALAGDSATPPPAPAVVSTPAAPVAPAAPVRKRGSFGLTPGESSVPTQDSGDQGEGTKEPSVAELRKMPLKDLQAEYRRTMAEKARRRNF